MSQVIVLYDLPSPEPCRCWSGNVWKTRLALNFKGTPYQTKWLPYIRLEETLKATGLSKNPAGSWSDYSVPTVQLPDGSYLMDSAVIAKKLEALYPTPSLHLNQSLEQEAQAAIMAVFVSLIPLMMSLGINKLIAPEDLEWFKQDRAKRFGMTVEELMAEKDPDAAYTGAKAGFEKCKKVLTAHKKDDGPFILGSVPSYADFYLVSTMQMYKQAGPQLFDRFFEEAGPELRALFEACKKWTLRQD